MAGLQKTGFYRNAGEDVTSARCRKGFQFGFLVYLILSLQGCATMAQEEFEWRSFHGPDRTNKSTEKGLLKEWPEAGPEAAWTVSGLGEGYSSVSVAEGYLFTAGIIDKKTYVFAFDLDGKQIWKKPNGNSWETDLSWARTYTGSRSTPTYDNGVVYHLNDLGRLAAFDYKTGNEIWNMELREQFDAEIPEYGYCESVFIEGDRLYCSPAGKKGYIVCLDKNDGTTIWTNREVPGPVGFSSPVLFDHGGYRQIAGLSANSVYGVDSETGKMLWVVEFENSRSNNITDPIFQDGHVFASTGYGKGSMLIKLNVSGTDIIPETVWQTDLMDNQHGGVIFHEGYLYGSGQEERGWFCLDFMTGRQMWKASGKGSLTYADGMLYCLEERGIMTLVRASPEKYEAVSTFEVPRGGKGFHWAHPVVCGGMLYIRHMDKLFAYDIHGK
ncbi:MAG: PQQ-like beta-propeller repeat protein [Bacteroidales bacterium]|nr:MAG: PQQ-like beta-propeller repeat protein [Bacteroidales bacterium]